MTDVFTTTSDPLFYPGFSDLDVTLDSVRFRGVIGGEGPPILLLHGYPQTHITWRFVAPELADNCTLIVPDLPGYGDSTAPQDGKRWTKRRVADSLVALMDRLGYERFAVVGHDRGARVGYRLALDHPDRVTAYVSLTVIPTLDAWAGVDKAFAMNAFHWFMLAQPYDLPERLLASDPDAFIDATLAKMVGSLDRFEPAVLELYRAAFRKPSVRHAVCEDYRAAAAEDLACDVADRKAGRKLSCPVLVLWPQRAGSDTTPVDVWRHWADDVSGHAISGGHLQPEFSAVEVIENLRPFLARAMR